MFSLWLYLPVQSKVSYSRELEEIFTKLDNMILQRDDYRKMKEERIEMLRSRKDMRASLEERFHTNKVLYDEYYVYNADSAMAYVSENLRIAELLKRKDWEYTWRINKSFLLSATGLLKEAEDELKDIPVCFPLACSLKEGKSTKIMTKLKRSQRKIKIKFNSVNLLYK